jgi:hypothetical protein
MGHVDPVVERMRALTAAWEVSGDRRTIFLSCYEMMTCNMLAAIDAGRFGDNGWVNDLLHRFAEYYFVALEAYERLPHSAPTVWQVAFHAAQQPHTHVLQSLSLGVNAHINFDLVFALADLLTPEWADLSPQQRQQRYRDHCLVNEIISQTIDGVQDQVIERQNKAMDLVDDFLGPLDEWLTTRLISAWRDQVWEAATHLVESQEENQRQDVQLEVEQRSLERAQAILGEQGFRGLLTLI